VDSWTDLGGGVRVRRSRACAMNSVLLLDAAHAVLVDPGVLPSELDDLADTVAHAGAAEVTLVFTHSHWDHVLGRPWWPGADTVAHAGLAAAIARDPAAIAAEADACTRGLGEPWTRGFTPFVPDVAVRGETAVARGPWRLVLREAPGHCDDQATVHVPALRLLVAGDMLSDLEVPWLDRGPAAYRRTLEGVAARVEAGEVETLVPGHGEIARGAGAVRARVRRDLRYLEALEEGVREARAAGLTLGQALARLAAIAPGDCDAGFPLADVHRENVRLAWEHTGPDEAGPLEVADDFMARYRKALRDLAK
jgi:glyoxylase-like metal-dependent hydrolase (beta-lactamase superfamily II)